jgi:thiamine pyrophosphokinase
MGHFVIVSGGSIEDAFACQVLDTGHYDVCIAADSGMEFFYRNGKKPNVIVGDFDSVQDEALSYFRSLPDIVFHELNPVKDDTDTEFAIRLAIDLGAESITLLGATGTRLDHVLGNIELLGIGLEQRIEMCILDSHNRIRMINHGITMERNRQYGRYVSLIPYSEKVEQLTLKGFKYPLRDFTLRGFCSLGVSNEIVEEKAEILFERGILLVIESGDDFCRP